MSDLMLKCIKFDFRWGSAIDPAGGAYSAPPAVFKGAYFQWCIGGIRGYTPYTNLRGFFDSVYSPQRS